MSSEPIGAMHPTQSVPNAVPPKGRGGNSEKYLPAGIVHRGSGMFGCSCGGVVWAHWDGEIFKHSMPNYVQLEHEALLGDWVSDGL